MKEKEMEKQFGNCFATRGAILFAALAATSLQGNAAVLFQDTFSPQQAGWSVASPSSGFLGELNNNVNVASAGLTVSPPVGTTSAVLSFDLLTFRSLDGVLNCCTDTFTFSVNGTTAFTGAFGAVPSVGFFTNPSLASFVELGAGSFGNSGTVRFTVNVALAPGANVFNWSFSPLQSLGDEAWGLDNVVLSTSDVPEPRTFFLALLSLAVLWRKQL